ncbi:hypothetical protein HY989_01950 [Candidatus Micrarchaeota archaeon]|nr:hypothetical protein [Candidatus Micrarchaeota archaeon]
MRLVVDANILFSAILKFGLTRKVWFNSDLELISPNYLLLEFSKYRPHLIGRYEFFEEEFDQLVSKLTDRIGFVEDSMLKPYLPAAESLIADEKDQYYIALALKTNSAIWSNDKALKAQRRVKVYTTEELALEFGSLQG